MIYKTQAEIRSMNNFELIAYKKLLAERARGYREELTEFTTSWKATIELLRNRAEDLEYDLLEMEDRRLSRNVADTDRCVH